MPNKKPMRSYEDVIKRFDDLIAALEGDIELSKAKLAEAKRLAKFVRDRELRKARPRALPLHHFKSLSEAEEFLRSPEARSLQKKRKR